MKRSVKAAKVHQRQIPPIIHVGIGIKIIGPDPHRNPGGSQCGIKPSRQGSGEDSPSTNEGIHEAGFFSG
jgi:hypothetical protein